MDLKAYQQQALETLERYLEALKDARKKADELSALNIDELPAVAREQLVASAHAAKDYPRVAWDSLREAAVLPGVSKSDKSPTPSGQAETRGQWAGHNSRIYSA